MDIRHLKIMIAVAESGSMSGAAKKLYITQPAVSQVIKELENHYGCQLFERLGKGIYITEAGKLLCSQARMVIRQFDTLQENMQHMRAREVLKVGSTITVGACIIPGLMADFQAGHSTVDPYNFVNNTKIIEARLLQSQLDIGLVEGAVQHPDLVVEPVIPDYLVIICSPHHPFAGRTFIDARELENETFVMREDGSGTRELFESFARNRGFHVKIGWEVTAPEIIKTIVQQNNALAAISIRLVEAELKNGSVYAIRHPENSWHRNFNLVYHKHKQITAGMQGFMELARKIGSREIPSDQAFGMLR